MALALLGIVLSSAPAAGLAPTGELRMVFDDANRVMNDPATEARPLDRLGAILAIVDRVFAYPEAARLALGPDWEARTPAEQEEFVRLFAELLQRTFVLAMATKASVDAGVEIRYRSESIAGDTAVVSTTVVARNREDVPVEYRMVRRGGAWAIQDVVWDGVSLVANYRAQFQRVIRASSYADLVARMRAKSLEVTAALPFTRALNPHVVAQPAPEIPRSPARGPGGGDRSEPRSEPVDRGAPGVSAPAIDGGAEEAATHPASPAMPGERTAAARSDGTRPSRLGGAGANDSGPRRTTALEGLRVAAVPETGTTRGPRMAVADRPATPAKPAASLAAEPLAQSRAPGSTRRGGPATYWVQVGAFVSADRAVQAVEVLLKRALPVSLDRRQTAISPATAQLIRVRVGPFADRTSATRALHDLAEPTAFIVVERE
jgi:phospholipid transport system substrate-binding protein